MENSSGPERRQNVRVSINVSMRLVVYNTASTSVLKGEEVTKLRTGTVNDISLTGMCLQTKELEDAWIFNMLSGTIRVAIQFQLKETSSPIHTSARVMWVKKEEEKNKLIGLKFEDITEADRFQIMRFIIEYKSKGAGETAGPD